MSLADPFYLGGYVAIAAALLMTTLMSTGERHRVDFDAVIDSVTVVVVSVLVFWNLSVAEILTDDTSSGFVRFVHASYPVLDAAMLALVLRALTTRRTRRALGVPFALGVWCWLVAHVGYLPFGDVFGTSSTAILDVIWMVGSVLLATATFRPQVLPDLEAPSELAEQLPLRTLGLAILPAARPARAAVVQRPRRRGADPRYRGRRRHDGAGPAHLRAHGAAAAPGEPRPASSSPPRATPPSRDLGRSRRSSPP